MGRRKITIKQIPDVKLRHITFNKRKNGLFKKAAELSVLCNLNLLLVCEDGLGNLIQFSKNKVTNINNFLSQCNYQNVIDLTSEDYPDFAKINKKKDKDKDDDESSPEEELPREKNTRTYAQMAAQPRDQPKTRRKSPSSSPVDEDQYEVSQRQKSRGLSMSISENPSLQANHGPDSVAKKNKNKLNLRLKIPKVEGGTESQTHINTEMDTKVQAPISEQNNFPSERQRKQSDYQPQRGVEKNNVDFTSPPFMPMDPLRRLGSYYESMASPFKFYGQNPRMEPLSSMLKGLSPFTFPLTGTPLVPKPNLADGEDKLFDAAAALRYMNRTGMAPETGGNSVGSHKVFTFQPEEGNLMNNRNELALMNQRQQMQNQFQMQNQMQNQMHEYMNLPSAMKSDLDFDINLPPETLSARRFNFDGYFKDFDENGFGDLRKKHKLS